MDQTMDQTKDQRMDLTSMIQLCVIGNKHHVQHLAG